MDWSQEAQKQWERLNDELQHLLTLEIKLRQDILSNLNQQEYVLLVGDLELKEELHQECKKIAKQLKVQAQERNSLMRKMIVLLPCSQHFDDFADLFHSSREDEAETLLLYQQLQALTEKVHEQKIRNKTLYALIRKGKPLDINTSSLHTSQVYPEGKEKKPLLITIDYPEKEPAPDSNDPAP
ncbi:MAG: hypothetical protein AAF443_01965 [Chlamydiota bacterium]